MWEKLNLKFHFQTSYDSLDVGRRCGPIYNLIKTQCTLSLNSLMKIILKKMAASSIKRYQRFFFLLIACFMFENYKSNELYGNEPHIDKRTQKLKLEQSK